MSKNASWKVELDAMKSRSAMLAFATAALMCALVWAASPWFTGRREPWDADSRWKPLGHGVLLVAELRKNRLRSKRYRIR